MHVEPPSHQVYWMISVIANLSWTRKEPWGYLWLRNFYTSISLKSNKMSSRVRGIQLINVSHSWDGKTSIWLSSTTNNTCSTIRLSTCHRQILQFLERTSRTKIFILISCTRDFSEKVIFHILTGLWHFFNYYDGRIWQVSNLTATAVIYVFSLPMIKIIHFIKNHISKDHTAYFDVRLESCGKMNIFAEKLKQAELFL